MRTLEFEPPRASRQPAHRGRIDGRLVVPATALRGAGPGGVTGRMAGPVGPTSTAVEIAATGERRTLTVGASAPGTGSNEANASTAAGDEWRGAARTKGHLGGQVQVIGDQRGALGDRLQAPHVLLLEYRLDSMSPGCQPREAAGRRRFIGADPGGNQPSAHAPGNRMGIRTFTAIAAQAGSQAKPGGQNDQEASQSHRIRPLNSPTIGLTGTQKITKECLGCRGNFDYQDELKSRESSTGCPACSQSQRLATHLRFRALLQAGSERIAPLEQTLHPSKADSRFLCRVVTADRPEHRNRPPRPPDTDPFIWHPLN